MSKTNFGKIINFKIEMDISDDFKIEKRNIIKPAGIYNFNANFKDAEWNINDFIKLNKNEFDLKGNIVTITPSNWFTKLLWKFIDVELNNTTIKLKKGKIKNE